MKKGVGEKEPEMPDQVVGLPDHVIKVDGGKYTFVHRGGWRIDVLRGGDPWVTDLDGSKAVASMMAELDAARVVVHAVRQGLKLIVDDPRMGLSMIEDALDRHRALVDDRERPTPWTSVCVCCQESPCACAESA
jgi:hypothetical protein